jgi:hypothetical protein
MLAYKSTNMSTENRGHDSQTYVSISQGRWLSQEEYNSKCMNNKKYDFCSYSCDDENKGKICGIIATKICRLETTDSSRFRCEECPLHAEDIYIVRCSRESITVDMTTIISDISDMNDLTPSSDSKLGRVSKYLTGRGNKRFWYDFSPLFPQS